MTNSKNYRIDQIYYAVLKRGHKLKYSKDGNEIIIVAYDPKYNWCQYFEGYSLWVRLGVK